jgi:histidyl-tRNA synthetase
VTRLLAPLIGAGRLRASGRCRPWCWSRSTRNRPGPRRSRWPSCSAIGIACEVAPAADKFGKQIRYADRRGIPFVWFGGREGGQVKDLRSGDQHAADPRVWLPPEDDRRPAVRWS